jgi:hypothetical protein
VTEEECKKVMDSVVAAFVERNPDLWWQATQEIYLYGAVSAETAQSIAYKMDAEAANSSGIRKVET